MVETQRIGHTKMVETVLDILNEEIKKGDIVAIARGSYRGDLAIGVVLDLVDSKYGLRPRIWTSGSSRYGDSFGSRMLRVHPRGRDSSVPVVKELSAKFDNYHKRKGTNEVWGF